MSRSPLPSEQLVCAQAHGSNAESSSKKKEMNFNLERMDLFSNDVSRKYTRRSGRRKLQGMVEAEFTSGRRNVQRLAQLLKISA